MADQESQLMLAIDDELVVTSLLKRVIESLIPNVTVEVANNGTTGIELSRSLMPDLILCDLMMPEPDGFEVCRVVSSDETTKPIHIVILTALNDDNSRNRCFEYGASEYLTKPFDPDELTETLQRVLREKRLGLYEKG